MRRFITLAKDKDNFATPRWNNYIDDKGLLFTIDMIYGQSHLKSLIESAKRHGITLTYITDEPVEADEDFDLDAEIRNSMGNLGK